jgi:RNA polymerase sigma factor (TIGR02999 family)
MELIDTPISAAKNAENTDALFTTLYSELHRLAKRQLARKWTPVSLSVTTLLHETYLDMAAGEGPSFPDGARFMGYAARVMRGLIIDHARRHRALKHGGEFEITSLQPDLIGTPTDAKELLLINDVLEQLAKVEPDLAELVDLKFFCGFSFGEIAAMQMLSERTVQRRWEKARIYIRHSMRADSAPGESNA